MKRAATAKLSEVKSEVSGIGKPIFRRQKANDGSPASPRSALEIESPFSSDPTTPRKGTCETMQVLRDDFLQQSSGA